MHASRTFLGTPHMHCATRFEITLMDTPVRKQRRRTEEIRRATNREPASERTRGRVEVTVRSKGRTDGKSVRRKNAAPIPARNTHDRTCIDRTKTRDFKMDNQRQETKSMNHFKSRTKPRDTRPNLNHRLNQCQEPRTTYHLQS